MNLACCDHGLSLLATVVISRLAFSSPIGVFRNVFVGTFLKQLVCGSRVRLGRSGGIWRHAVGPCVAQRENLLDWMDALFPLSLG